MKRIQSITLMLLSLGFWTACESDITDDLNNPGNPNNPRNPNPAKALSADEASEHLVLKNHAKITGTLPNASDGQLKLDVEDTIYVVKGYPLGSRIEVLHHPGENVAGFNITVPGSTFYFHVPETIIEGQYEPSEESDSISIIELDFDPPVDEVDYPYTTEIVIQPVDDNGNPLDEFERWVTVEDPEQSSTNGSGCNTIARPVNDNNLHWEWDFTVRELNGDIVNVFAPGLATRINSQGSGCCGDNGRSYAVGDTPACVPNTTAQHLTWVELEVDDYSVRPFELWQIYENGTVRVYSNEIKKTYNRPTTNFCTGVIGYTFDNDDTGGIGTHNFVAGGSHISFDFPNWEGGWRPQGGTLIYTCHTMIISWGGGDKFSAVYKRIIYDPYPQTNPLAFYSLWKPWFD